MSKNLTELSFRKGLENNLFEKLGEASKKEGTPSNEDLEALAKEFLIGKANTYGTASFYDFMKPENKGKKVYVCNGTACVCSGKQEKVKAELKIHFKEEEIGHMTCLGRCHENAAFNYDGKNYSMQNIASVLEGKATNQDHYNIEASVELLTKEYEGFDKHYSLLKKF